MHRSAAKNMKRMITELQQECDGLQIKNTSFSAEKLELLKSLEESNLKQTQLRTQANQYQEELLLARDVVLRAQKQERELSKSIKEKAHLAKDTEIEYKLLQVLVTNMLPNHQSQSITFSVT